ncbi:flavin monoamine oxidase family protein [Microcella humidisoli]|uniref:FAD-dependent oxidoreductase n=1 Tax=Microcella humidisoli TaxID=2963406 RepID=A0ABY5FW59_9MICO|nr:NAD(P)/FAD-dependent oxidoreductase [Microcella humidisoli]UTT62519.1 FAD-dependent oxidoreductase [Microcella humidisoli]
MSGLTRRQFGAVAVGSTAAAALAACTPFGGASSTRGEGLTVVVVGAGVAGLAAARDLHRAGAEVIVLDARDRIGGRTATLVREGFALDLGASWIHGVDGNPVAELVDEAGLGLIETDVASSIGFDAATASGLVDDAALSRAGARLDAAVEAGYDADVDQPLRLVVDDAVRGAAADEARLIRYLAASAIENEYAGSIDQLSAWWFDDAGEYGGGDVMIEGGYAQVPELLADGLDVRLSTVVTAVRWGADGVAVETTAETVEADAVVITVPLGVLQAGAIVVDPPLPESHQTAIDALGMGVLNKVFLQFDEVFWDDSVDWIGIVPPEGADPWVDWVTVGRAGGVPVLLGFAAGDLGRRVDVMTDEQALASALRTLRSAYPGAPDPVDALVTRWGADEFARGSYSFAAVGSDPAMRDDLAAPVGGRLHLAGEATSREHPSTVHGALLSGRRAAENVLGDLGA